VKDKILVLNPDNRQYNPLLRDFGEVTNDALAFKLNPEKFKLVQFTGGEDVSPELYGDTSPINYCMSGPGLRDKEETRIFNIATKHNIPMVGICRGIQFLNVMCGGKLIHHLDGHVSNQHKVGTSCSSAVFDSFVTNSLHHQMCIPPYNGHILSWSIEKQSTRYVGDKDEDMDWVGPEVEGIFIPRHHVLGVQWHPEMMLSNSKGYTYYLMLVNDLLTLTLVEFGSKHVTHEGLRVEVING
jgi:putative glutamine amidotransferase